MCESRFKRYRVRIPHAARVGVSPFVVDAATAPRSDVPSVPVAHRGVRPDGSDNSTRFPPAALALARAAHARSTTRATEATCPSVVTATPMLAVTGIEVALCGK